jgi:hypothetical protein
VRGDESGDSDGSSTGRGGRRFIFGTVSRPTGNQSPFLSLMAARSRSFGIAGVAENPGAHELRVVQVAQPQ